MHLPVVIEKDGNSEKAYDLYSRLLKVRIIFVGTPIDDQVANAIMGQLLFLESEDASKDIQMYINSPGGIVTAGLGIYDTMRYVKPDIVGCFLLAAGTKGKRFSLPHSRIMMHQVQGGQRGAAPDVEIQYEEMMRLNNMLMEVLASNTGHSIDEVKERYQRDKWMDPLEAKNFGIIDDVHEFSTRGQDE